MLKKLHSFLCFSQNLHHTQNRTFGAYNRKWSPAMPVKPIREGQSCSLLHIWAFLWQMSRASESGRFVSYATSGKAVGLSWARKRPLDTLDFDLQKQILQAKEQRKMTDERKKFAGFTRRQSQVSSRSCWRQVKKLWQKHWLVKWTGRRINQPSIKFFKVWQRIWDKVCCAEGLKIKSVSRASFTSHLRTYGFDRLLQVLVISVKAMSITQSFLRKTSTNLELAQLSIRRWFASYVRTNEE